jgi:hypothetical protein
MILVLVVEADVCRSCSTIVFLVANGLHSGFEVPRPAVVVTDCTVGLLVSALRRRCVRVRLSIIVSNGRRQFEDLYWIITS